ncbi:MAG: MBL fold metallo-hydrolase, partial [Opitutales bacterium]
FGVTGALADVLAQRDFLTVLVGHVEKQIAAGRSRAEIITLTNLPGFPDYDSDPKSSRLPGNLGAVYDELTGAKT